MLAVAKLGVFVIQLSVRSLRPRASQVFGPGVQLAMASVLLFPRLASAPEGMERRF